MTAVVVRLIQRNARTVPVSVNGLHRIQQQIQHHLVDLIAVVFDFGQSWILLQFDLDRL